MVHAGHTPATRRPHAGYTPATRSNCVSYSYTVRACLIVTVHGSISCTDPLRPARRSTYRNRYRYRWTWYRWYRLPSTRYRHKITIYRRESPIYFTVTRFLLTELYISSCFVSLRQFSRATQSVLVYSGKCHRSHFLIKV